MPTTDPAEPDGAGIVWIPVRHHSPASARVTAELIEAHRPAAVLVEGPSEVTDLDAVLLGHQLPIAVMSWTRADSGDHEQTTYALYPLTEFSPEWQAISGGVAVGARVEFIDLPWRHVQELRRNTGSGRAVDAAATLLDVEPGDGFYATLARYTGRSDLASVWDEFFEIDPHLDPGTYLRRAALLGAGIRLSSRIDDGRPDEENSARERHMAHRIARVRAETSGILIVVTGAFHTAGLQQLLAGQNVPDRPVAEPPAAVPQATAAVEHGTALVPTSYRELSTDSGYLAGQPDPGFYHRVFADRSADAVPDLLYHAVDRLRGRHVAVSPADAIAAMTTAKGLQQIRGHTRMWRDDLVDGIASALVKDVEENHPLLRALHEELCGDQVGRLAPGTPVPHLVGWVTARCAELGIPLSRAGQDLTTDVDDGGPGRARSQLLHQLRALEVPGVHLAVDVTGLGRDGLSARDEVRTSQIWRLRWTDRSEAALILAGRWGPTGPSAASAVLTAKAADAEVAEVAEVLFDAARCGIGELSGRLVARLGDALHRSEDLIGLATVLRTVIRLQHFEHWLGTVGRDDLATLVVLAQARCVRALERLAGPVAAADPTRVADALRTLIESTIVVADELPVDVDGLHVALGEQLRAGHRPEIAGALVGAAWLLTGDPEHGLSAALGDPAGTGEFYAGLVRVARHLATASPQIFDPADLAMSTWTDEEFLVALPGLRRAFSGLNRSEKQALLARLTGRDERPAVRFSVDESALLHLAARETALWNRATNLIGDLFR